MRSLPIVLSLLFVFLYIAVPVRAGTILFENFSNSSGLILGGCDPKFWDIAPLGGTTLYPSQFQKGGSSQGGKIFYGVFAKEIGSRFSATMTLLLPDLTKYNNLELSVALASPGRIWEPTHRDSLHIIGNTTTEAPEIDCDTQGGCLPTMDTVDSFLPISYPDFLRSREHSIPLGLEFQDFNYSIDSTFRSLTIAFASTDYPEYIGIDSVRIRGDRCPGGNCPGGAPVPEPTTMLLFGAGIVGIVGGRIRRKK